MQPRRARSIKDVTMPRDEFLPAVVLTCLAASRSCGRWVSVVEHLRVGSTQTLMAGAHV